MALAKGRPERLVASAEVLETAGTAEASRWTLAGTATLRGRTVPTRIAVPA